MRQNTGPSLLGILGAPAFRFFDWWHSLGLPPQGEAAVAGPFFAFFVQWMILEVIAGILLEFWHANATKE